MAFLRLTTKLHSFQYVRTFLLLDEFRLRGENEVDYIIRLAVIRFEILFAAVIERNWVLDVISEIITNTIIYELCFIIRR